MRSIQKIYILLPIAAVLLLCFLFLFKDEIVEIKQTPKSQTLQQEFESYYNQGNYEFIIKKAEDILASDPNNQQALLALATTYAQLGSVRFNEEEMADLSISLVNQVLQKQPNNSEAYRILAYAHEIKEQYDLAHSNYDKAIELNPNNFQAYVNKGHSYALQGDYTNAEMYLQKSLDIAANNDLALLNLGRLASINKDYAGAREYFDRVLNSSVNNRAKAEALQMAAEVFSKEKNYESGLQTINKALEYDDKFAQAQATKARLSFMIGRVVQDGGLLVQAEKHANLALEINPQQTTALTVLADYYEFKKDDTKAAEYLNLALDAVEKDITLGAKEKAVMKSQLENRSRFEILDEVDPNAPVISLHELRLRR